MTNYQKDSPILFEQEEYNFKYLLSWVEYTGEEIAQMTLVV